MGGRIVVRSPRPLLGLALLIAAVSLATASATPRLGVGIDGSALGVDGPAPGVAVLDVPDPSRALSPVPRSVRLTGRGTPVPGSVGLVATGSSDRASRPAAVEEAEALLRDAGATRVVRAGPAGELPDTRLVVYVGGPAANPASAGALRRLGVNGPVALPAQGYVLASGPDGGRWSTVLAGADATGTYHAVQTLDQLVERDTRRALVPGGTVRDWPATRSRGVIEGFYGPPWSDAERRDQLAFYGDHKLDTYIYAPKDDPYHRERWRRPYPARQLDRLAGLVREARRHHVDFVFAVSPGQSVCHSGDADFRALTRKMGALYRVGVRRFALFFDDIAAELRCPQDRRRFADDRSPAAAAQAYLLNRFTREFLRTRPGTGPLLTVPTQYTGAGASPYKRRFAGLVGPEVEVFWTGREVVSPAIPDAGAGAARKVFRHPLLVWDNYPVNDFQVDRLFLGPVTGRGDDLAGSGVRGFIANPMIQAAPSKLAVATVADHAWNPGAYDPERSFDRALRELGGPAYTALRTFALNNHSSRLHGEEARV
ncbi:MAG: beta-N-acetylhexosaminidase family protein, partial [Streptomycetales bacterium]